MVKMTYFHQLFRTIDGVLALRVGEAVYWVSMGHYEAVAVGKDTINCPEKSDENKSF